jgi:Leucine-rich repeat (LRR) protein
MISGQIGLSASLGSIFFHAERLEWLKLGNNSVHEIPSVALEPMHRLREFDMKGNNITDLQDNSFRGFGNTLKYLSLENNM